MWGSKGKKWLQLHEGGEVTLSPPQFSPPLSFLLSFLFSLLLNYFSPLSPNIFRGNIFSHLNLRLNLFLGRGGLDDIGVSVVLMNEIGSASAQFHFSPSHLSQSSSHLLCPLSNQPSFSP